jgi:outer membrane protein
MMPRAALAGLTVSLTATLGATLGASTALAQPKTLTQALVIAYSTNPTLLAARAQLRATDENVPQALAGWRPTIIVSGSGGYLNGVAPDIEGQALGGAATNLSRDVLTLQATITQPIYTGGATVANTNHAENQVLSQRAQLLVTEQTVMANVISSYVNVIQDQQLVALNASNVQVLSEQLRATNDRFRVGEITQTDVAQAQAALSEAQAQLATAEGNLQTSRASFRQFVGELPGELVEPQPLKPPLPSETQVVQFAASNNPNVVAALFGDAAAKDAVDVAFSKLMPNVSLQGIGERLNNNQLPNSQQSFTEALVSVTIPIYQGGSEYSAVRQAKQTEQQSRKSVDDARRQAMQQAAQAWETLVAARATISSTQAAIRANEVALEGVQREALLGTRTTLDVLNAEQTLLDSRQTLIQNLANLVTASYSVAASMGRLTARDLKLPVAYYDETAYYNAVRNKLFGTGDQATDQPGR